MLSFQFSQLQSFCMLVIGLAIIWGLFWALHKAFISLNRPKVKRFFEPLVYYEYFCPNGHYLGTQKPPLGTLCTTCIEKGYIQGGCNIDGETHPAKIITTFPPYRLLCPVHGEHTANAYSIGGKPVSLEKWLEVNKANPLPTPLPTYNPLPTPLAEAARQKGIPLLTLDPVQRRIKSLENTLRDRINELEAVIDSQKRHLRLGYPGSVLLALGLLIFACSFLSVTLDTITIKHLIIEFPKTAVWALPPLVEILITFAVVLYLVKQFKRENKIESHDARLSFILAEVISLVILPSLLEGAGSLNPYLIFIGLIYDLIAEIVIAILWSKFNLRRLRIQGDFLRKTLKDVRDFLQSLNDDD